jgi:hypothetical protein
VLLQGRGNGRDARDRNSLLPPGNQGSFQILTNQNSSHALFVDELADHVIAELKQREELILEESLRMHKWLYELQFRGALRFWIVR